MLSRFVSCIMLLGVATAGYAQEPLDIVRTTINGKEVWIEYGRPLLKGRNVAIL